MSEELVKEAVANRKVYGVHHWALRCGKTGSTGQGTSTCTNLS